MCIYESVNDMTSRGPIKLPPLPPIKIGDKIEAKVDAVNENGLDGVVTIDDGFIIEVKHAEGMEDLRVGKTVKLVITEIFPEDAEGLQI